MSGIEAIEVSEVPATGHWRVGRAFNLSGFYRMMFWDADRCIWVSGPGEWTHYPTKQAAEVGAVQASLCS